MAPGDMRFVEFKEAKGRMAKFTLNNSGSIDLYLAGKMKVQKIKNLVVTGNNCIHFDGKKIMMTEKEVVVPEESLHKIPEVLSLCKDAADTETTSPVETVRCFIFVECGTGLRAADIGGKSDPYVVAQVPGREKTTSDRTAYKSRTLNPKWHEYIEISDYQLGEEILFDVFDYDFMSTDDYLGSVTVPKEKLSDGSFAGTLNLQDDQKHGAQGKKTKGSITVRIEITGGAELRKPDLPARVSAKTSKEVEAVMQKLSEHQESAAAAARDEAAEMQCEASVRSRKSRPSVVNMEAMANGKTDAVMAWVEPEEAQIDSVHAKHASNSFQPLRDLTEVREEMFLSLFELLDPQDGMVSSASMQKVAHLLGILVTKEEWEIEYKEAAAEEGWDIKEGVTEQELKALFDKQNGFAYCDNSVLEDMISELRCQENAKSAGSVRAPVIVARCWVPHDSLKAEQGKSRPELVAAVFDALTKHSGSNMVSEEFRTYAELCGFMGTDEDWNIEYTELCFDEGMDPKKGADRMLFNRMVSEEKAQAYSDDIDLREVADTLKQGFPYSRPKFRQSVWHMHPKTLEARSKRPRSELVEYLFEVLDADGSGTLGPDELRCFAQQCCGLESSDEEWAVHWAEVCMVYNLNHKGGANKEQFAKLIDTKGGLSHIGGSELIALTENAKRRIIAPEMTTQKTLTQRSWQPVTKNFDIIRSFALLLKEKFHDVDEAFQFFTSKKLGRLSRDDFSEGLKRANFQGDGAHVFRLLALGTDNIIKKHFRWVWNLLDAEHLVLARSSRRLTQAPSARNLPRKCQAPTGRSQLAPPTER